VFHNLGTAGVQVFFALTGYLFTRKAVAARGQLALRPFLVARVRRIVPMYTAAVAFSIALVCVVTRHEPVAWGRLLRQSWQLYAFGFVLDGSPTIKSVPYADVLGTIWSLPFEWLFYLFVPVLAALVTSRWLLAVAAAALAVYFGNLMSDGRGDVFCPFFLPGVLAGLVPVWNAPSPCGRLGGGVPRERGSVRADPSPRPLPQGEWEGLRRLMAVAALLLTAAAVLPGVQNFTPSRLLLMTALFGAVLLARPDVLAWPVIALLGDISYSIYLIHFPILFAVNAALHALDPAGAVPLGWAAAFLAASGVVVVTSAVTYRWIEMPFLHRRAAAAAAVPALV
jgi:peptidoglycan/LPS O-acetylase OafA/YrhL